MNKRILGLSTLCLLSGMTVSTLASCGGIRRGGGGDKIDSSKLQIYIHNFSGGFGDDWLADLKTEYEDLHKEDQYDDKTGVQLVITGDKKVFNGPEILTNKYDIYFAEQAKYPYYVANQYLEDISEAITGENPYEPGKTIADKMDDTQKAFYGYDGATKYYGIPHYSGVYGINYNIDLFKDRGYYYKKGHPEVSEKKAWDQYFIDVYGDDMAPGPDGIEGTYDDGLPETLDEFYWLCDKIANDGRNALVWAGANYTDYTAQYASALASSLNGAEATGVQYSFDGTLNNLVTVSNGTVTPDASSTTITDANGYEATRTSGRYYALTALEKMINTTKWHHPKNMNASQTHLTAQMSFVTGVEGQDDSGKDSAMLIDGSWWQAEAAQAWDYMEKNCTGKQSPLERDFGYMPFPKVNKSDAYTPTYQDQLNSLQFVKAGISETKKAVAIDFLQFINTDEKLAQFTETTYTTRCLNYTLTEEQLSKISLYGRHLYEYKHAASTKVVYPMSKNPIYVNNQDSFVPYKYFKSTINGSTIQFPAEAFKLGKGNAEDVFNGSYTFFKNLWKSVA